MVQQSAVSEAYALLGLEQVGKNLEITVGPSVAAR